MKLVGTVSTYGVPEEGEGPESGPHTLHTRSWATELVTQILLAFHFFLRITLNKHGDSCFLERSPGLCPPQSHLLNSPIDLGPACTLTARPRAGAGASLQFCPARPREG